MKKAQNNQGNPKFITESYLDTRLHELRESIKDSIEGAIEDSIEGAKNEMREEMRGQTTKVLQAIDVVVTRFDTAEKEHTAHTLLHKRITDELHGHDQRIKKLEAHR